MNMHRNIAADFANQHGIHEDDALELLLIAAERFFATGADAVIEVINNTSNEDIKGSFMTLAYERGEDVEFTRFGHAQIWDMSVDGVRRAIIDEASGGLMAAYKRGLYRTVRNQAA